MTVSRKLALVTVSASLFTAMPAAAQVKGEWETVFGKAQLEISNSSTEVPEPGWISTWFRTPEGDPRRGWRNIRFDGRYRGLVWEGTWHMPADRTIVRGMRRCDRTSIPRGGRNYDATPYFGKFRFTFNTAENRFDGVWYNCDRALPTQSVGYLATYFITGTRLNTYSGAANNSIRPTSTISSEPVGDTGPRRVTDPILELNPRGTTWLRPQGGVTETRLVLSPRYRIRPGRIDALAGDKFQIDLIQPEGKRPMRLVLKGIDHLGGRPPAVYERGVYDSVLMFNGKQTAIGLPFVPDPRPGNAIANRTMNAQFCSSVFWLAYLDFSDGTQSPPIAILLSPCGERLHPPGLLMLAPQPGEPATR